MGSAVEIGATAEFEFGQGEEWRQAAKEGKKEAAPGDVKESLGRPAVIIACSALKKYYRDILRGKVDADPPSADDLVSRGFVTARFVLSPSLPSSPIPMCAIRAFILSPVSRSSMCK